MENEKKYQTIQVVVDTRIIQNGESETHHFVEEGQLAKVNGSTYVRYVEHFENQATPVTFKIIDEKHVRLTRKSINELKFEFAEGESTKDYYQTPYGKMEMEVVTSKVDVKINHAELSGKINVDYELHNSGEKVGDYHIKLHFGL